MEVKTRKSNVGNINQSQPKPEEETAYFYSLPAEDAADCGEGEDEDTDQTDDQDDGHSILHWSTLQSSGFSMKLFRFTSEIEIMRSFPSSS